MSGTAFADGSPMSNWGPWLADAGLFALPDDPPVKIPTPTDPGFDVKDDGESSPKPSQSAKDSK